MLTKNLQTAIVEQLNKEFHSAYIYLGMSAYCSKEGFNGAFVVAYRDDNRIKL